MVKPMQNDVKIDCYVIGFVNKEGFYELLAWTNTNLSRRELKRACKKFKHDGEAFICPYYRFYNNSRDARCQLPRY